MRLLAVLLLLSLALPSLRADLPYRRIAVMGAFQEEIDAIEKELLPTGAPLASSTINGIRFDEADLGGKHYIFFLSGISMVNAAMSTQLALDRFHPDAVVFTGIAGGVDPGLLPGDVIVPASWIHQTESAWLNPDPRRPGHYVSEDARATPSGHYGMIFFRDVRVVRDGQEKPAPVHAFPASPRLLAAAAEAAKGLTLEGGRDRPAKVVCGGQAMSGPVFLDNAAFRAFAWKEWGVQGHDMESTAVAQVCWANQTPVLVVRGLSDLAGGQAGPNEIKRYVALAAKNAALVTARTLRGL